MSPENIPIDIPRITKLLHEQFPQYANLPITSVREQGHDNRTFRLGHDKSLRLPSAQRYAEKVAKEHRWLSHLAPSLSLRIPKPLHLGRPSQHYPFPWSIYEWIPGTPLNQADKENLPLTTLAQQLAYFLTQLHGIDTSDAPIAGKDTFFRGCPLSHYDHDTRTYIDELSPIIYPSRTLPLWEKATRTTWDNPPVWFHGDLVPTNMLIDDKGTLKAIIDFRGIAIGDPACDLVMYWYFFEPGTSQDTFRQTLSLDSDTWHRARGWALWKAYYELTNTSSQDLQNTWTTIIDKIIVSDID